jgi:hypothetical protein
MTIWMIMDIQIKVLPRLPEQITTGPPSSLRGLKHRLEQIEGIEVFTSSGSSPQNPTGLYVFYQEKRRRPQIAEVYRRKYILRSRIPDNDSVREAKIEIEDYFS